MGDKTAKAKRRANKSRVSMATFNPFESPVSDDSNDSSDEDDDEKRPKNEFKNGPKQKNSHRHRWSRHFDISSEESGSDTRCL